MSGLIDMRVAVSSPDEFVAPYLCDALGDALVPLEQAGRRTARGVAQRRREINVS